MVLKKKKYDETWKSWKCSKYYKHFQEYRDKKLKLDIRKYLAAHPKLRWSPNADELRDIKSELKVKWIKEISEYAGKGEIDSPRNLTFTICKNYLKDYLNKFNRHRSKSSKYKQQLKGKAMQDSNNGKYNLISCLDELQYFEIREIFRKHLDIRQNAIIILKLCRYSNEDIASLLKLSTDYIRKLFKQAEIALVRELLQEP